MDVSRSHLPIATGGRDPHGWQSWDNYRAVHERRLERHPFPDPSRPNTLDFDRVNPDRWVLSGLVYCYRNAVLEVEKAYHTRRVGGRGIIQVRCYSFLYVGWIAGGNLALKYHNHHADPDEYIHRVYHPITGREVLYEVLHRHQFPMFAEVLDELEAVTRG